MIDSYWDLYVAYIAKCVDDNRNNDIDPHHYRMEWNHFLPKNVFGDWPIGHHLTLKQHAVASALQTLALQKNCMCGWHKEYLPGDLVDLAWSYYKKQCAENGNRTGPENIKAAQSALTPETLSENGKRTTVSLHLEKDSLGRSAHAVKMSALGNKKKHSERDDYGRSLAGKKSCFAEKARTIRVTKLETGEVFDFANSIEAGMVLGLVPRSLRRVAAGERNSVHGYAAEFTDFTFDL
jgi:hypothetical protein